MPDIPGGFAASAGRYVAACDPRRDPAHSPGRDFVARIETDTLHALRQRFLGNCTGVASNRHDYRWRYVKPGARPRDQRESPTARENIAATRAPATMRESPPPREKVATPKENAVPPREKVASPKEKVMPPCDKTAATKDVAWQSNIPMRGQVGIQVRPEREAAMTKDTSTACHARRRVAGDERPSQDDARRAAENGWMGAVRNDFGERYQDINRAKDVRLNCGPSSTSAVLKTPHFRCSVEATPCREMQGTPMEPDERRDDPPLREDQIRVSRPAGVSAILAVPSCHSGACPRIIARLAPAFVDGWMPDTCRDDERGL